MTGPRQSEGGTAEDALYGAKVMNRMRIGLIVLFYASTFGSWNLSPLTLNIAYLCGISTMVVYAGVIALFLRKGRAPSFLSRAAILLDIVVLTVVQLSGTQFGPEIATITLKSHVLYVIYFVYVGYAGLAMSSPRFVLFTGFFATVCEISVTLSAYHFAGVTFSALPNAPSLENTVGIANEVLKPVFLIAFTVVMTSSLRILTALRTRAQEDSRQARDSATRLAGRTSAMTESAQLLGETAVRIRAAMAKLNERLASQSATLEEIAATMEELSGSADQTSHLVHLQHNRIREMSTVSSQLERMVSQITRASGETQSHVKSGGEAAEKSAEAAESVKKVLEEIVGSFQRVAEVNTLMADVADRTNLLSLNAAIEAARAGEHGLGFGIVAQEVGKLADSSHSSAKAISSSISQIGRSVETGRQSADQASGLGREQLLRFQELAENFKVLSTTIQQQETMHRGVIEAMRDLEKTASEIGAAAGEQRDGTTSVSGALVSMEGDVMTIVGEAQAIQVELEKIEGQARRLEQG